MEEYLFLVEPFADGQFYNLIQLDSVGLQLFHIQLGRDDDFVFLEHLYHPPRSFQKSMERTAEGVETAFQPFDQMRLVDGSKRIGHMFRHLAGGDFVRGAILHRTITGVMQAASVEYVRVHLFQIGRRRIDQLYIGVDEEFQQFGRHLIGAVGGVKQLRKMDLVGIARLVLDIAAGSAHHHFLQHFMAKFLIDGIDTVSQETGAHRATLRHKTLEFLDPRGKCVGNVVNSINRTACDILEQ